MFEIEPTPLQGLHLVRPTVRDDPRGWFMKLVHEPSFSTAGLVVHFPEQYASMSIRGVLRGMHFQKPPHDHAKLVYCLSGRVLDVVVDLRRAGGSYGACFSKELDGEQKTGLYIPTGFAHGFLTLSEEAVLLYNVGTVHSPDHDTGVRWDSIGFDWPIRAPITSDRDREFTTLDAFDSPF